MSDQSAGGDDDWVKQMLAEAMLGRTSLPPVSSDAAAEDPLETVEEAAEDPLETAEDKAEETAAANPPDDLGEPKIRYQVVLDEPVLQAVPDDAQVEEFAAEPNPDELIPVDLAPADSEVTPTPLVLEPEPALVAEPENDVPAPATTSRLFERPAFDATHDPGVNEMLEQERVAAEPLPPVEERSQLRGVLEWVVVLGSAVVVALLLRAFLFQAFFIPSESMESTLQVDDRVLVNKLSYRIGDVNRGEVVVFRRPDDQPGEFRDLIKRVIGLPGESIEARDNTIFIDGQALIEPYLTPGEVIGDFGPIDIPEGEYFVMGDNRDNSGDSRVFGPVDEERLIGRAFFVFWPLDRIGSL